MVLDNGVVIACITAATGFLSVVIKVVFNGTANRTVDIQNDLKAHIEETRSNFKDLTNDRRRTADYVGRIDRRLSRIEGRYGFGSDEEPLSEGEA